MVKTVVPKSKMLSQPVYTMMQQLMPVPCVDLVIVRRDQNRNIEILLIKRKIYPEIGKWCLIGGRILKGEAIAETIARQAKNEIGLRVAILKPWNIHQPVGVFNVPWADAQKHYISLTYPVVIIQGTVQKSGPEFSDAQWFSAKKFPSHMGFIHHEQLEYALKQISQLSF